jgi:hypothetical protein
LAIIQVFEESGRNEFRPYNEGGGPLFYGKNVKVRLLSGLALGSRLTAAA